jgi:hypothetical protein
VTSRKSPRDTAQLAKLVVDIATGEVADRGPTPKSSARTRPPWRSGAKVPQGREGSRHKKGSSIRAFGIAGLSGQSHHGPALTCTWFHAENLVGDLRPADLSGCRPSRQAPPIRW